MTQIRAEWKIRGAAGHGEWHEERSRANLMSFVDQGNLDFGRGSHWLGVKEEASDLEVDQPREERNENLRT